MLTDRCGSYSSGSTSADSISYSSSSSSTPLVKSDYYGQPFIKIGAGYAHSTYSGYYGYSSYYQTIIGYGSSYPSFTISFYSYLIKNQTQNCCKGPFFLGSSATDFIIGVVVTANRIVLEWYTDTSCTRGSWSSPSIETIQKWLHITVAYNNLSPALKLYINGELFFTESRAIPNKYCKTN